MRVRSKVRFVVASAALLGVAVPACGDPNAFQPITYGAKRWTPPPGWDPKPQCMPAHNEDAGIWGAACTRTCGGLYIAIDTCTGCTGISYALCSGVDFNQCVCGSPFTPGAICPTQFHCAADDFPPENWLEFTDSKDAVYMGPGWAGLDIDAGGE